MLHIVDCVYAYILVVAGWILCICALSDARVEETRLTCLYAGAHHNALSPRVSIRRQSVKSMSVFIFTHLICMYRLLNNKMVTTYMIDALTCVYTPLKSRLVFVFNAKSPRTN